MLQNSNSPSFFDQFQATMKNVRETQIVITPIAEKYKSKKNLGPCSRRDWEMECERTDGQRNWDAWKPSKKHRPHRQDYFAAVFRETATKTGHVEVYRITDVHSPFHRPVHWGDNIGQRDRDVIDLGPRVVWFTWEQWIASGANSWPQGTSRCVTGRENVLQMIEEHCSVQIQSSWRRMAVRRRVTEMQNKIVIVQQIWRGRKARQGQMHRFKAMREELIIEQLQLAQKWDAYSKLEKMCVSFNKKI